IARPRGGGAAREGDPRPLGARGVARRRHARVAVVGDGRHGSRAPRTGLTAPRRAADSIARVQGIHHLGVAVTDLDEAIATYERLFQARLEHRAPIAEQGVEAASLLVGASRFELLTPTGDDTPVGRFLAKRGPGMHHVALATDDLQSTLA